ncbi:MAG: hypothetical protein ACI8QS_002266 [Planctomycetota bacterium]
MEDVGRLASNSLSELAVAAPFLRTVMRLWFSACVLACVLGMGFRPSTPCVPGWKQGHRTAIRRPGGNAARGRNSPRGVFVGVLQDAGAALAGSFPEPCQIQEMTSLIQELGEETDMLALKANIEAGQHGRGFSVVSSERNDLGSS